VGSNTFTYQWRHNGVIISGEIEHILVITKLTPDNAGVYTCTVINEYGDDSSSSTSLNVIGN